MLAILLKVLPSLAGAGFLGAAMTMLQVSEYFTAEVLLILSTVAFIVQINGATTRRSYRSAAWAVVILLNLYFGAVVYRAKGSAPWSRLLSSPDAFKVDSVLLFSSPARQHEAFFVRSARPQELMFPLNIYAFIRVTNTSPFPIRIVGYKGRITDFSGFIRQWADLVPIPLGSNQIMFTRKGRSSMFAIESAETSVDVAGNAQIEATRSSVVRMGFEYQNHFTPPPNFEVEVSVDSDLAGSARVIYAAAPNPDPGTGATTGIDFHFGEIVDTSKATFSYYADVRK